MNFKDEISLLLLCGLIIFTIIDCKSCDYNGLIGKEFTMKLSVPKTYFDIKWTFENKILIRRKDNKMVTPSEDMELTSDGSLHFKSVKKENAGSYKAEGYDEGGTRKLEFPATLCVFDKFSKPEVNVTCLDQKVILRCKVKADESLTFIWYQNGQPMKETQQSISSGKDANYKCTVSNPVYNDTSNVVSSTKDSCLPSIGGGIPDKLFGFDFWIMVSILAGGGGLVLLLMIVLGTCACRTCKRREQRLRDEEELRLNNFATPPQRSKHTAKGQPAPPVPQEDPEVSNYEVDEPPSKPQTKPKNPTRVRPPPPPIDEDEQPPPLPQPRKKAPRTKKNHGPVYMQP